MKYLGYFMAAVFVVDFIASVPKRFKAISEFVEKIKKPNEPNKPEVEKKLDSTKEEIKESSDPKSLEENGSFVDNIDNVQPENFNNEQGLDFINNEQLPPASDVQAMEQGIENMNENGEINQNEENVQEDPNPVDDKIQGNEENEFEGLAELFGEA
ncbi:hypothetical protein [Paenibacillus sp. AR247]|uniref:hypothetical protein n=1 Tax=Paenibacillus sp. AR247 TaxID=1631599 RepID=UPI000CF9D372|nr:hypothetical protein [Paenibacillus sp. AR247]PQP88290.1 hypothetical protein CPT76_07800 [Paenibacillus sp. AR247]